MATFTVVYVADSDWVPGPAYYARCECGIASGQGHPTLVAARNEPMHQCHKTRTYPVWDGKVIQCAS